MRIWCWDGSNGEKPIGGKLEQLDSDAARESIREHIAQPLGMEVMDAAEAIIRVANSKDGWSDSSDFD